MNENQILDILIEYEEFGNLNAIRLIRQMNPLMSLLETCKYLKTLVKDHLNKEILQHV